MELKGYQSVSTRAGTTSLYDSLPPNAQTYYRHPVSETSISNLISRWSTTEAFRHCLGLPLLYPLCRIRYLAANEVMVVLEGGNHKILSGPGLRYFFLSFSCLLSLEHAGGSTESTIVFSTPIPLEIAFVKAPSNSFSCRQDVSSTSSISAHPIRSFSVQECTIMMTSTSRSPTIV
jgi:hypothetical protein